MWRNNRCGNVMCFPQLIAPLDVYNTHTLSIKAKTFIIFSCMLLFIYFTCVLSELVHGLEVYDVGREPAVHLAEDHASSSGVAAPNGRLYLVRDGRAVWPPPAVFVQPFPHHHGGGLEHVVTVGPGKERDKRVEPRKRQWVGEFGGVASPSRSRWDRREGLLGTMEGKTLLHKTRVMVLILGELKVGMHWDVYINFVEICVCRFRPVSYVSAFCVERLRMSLLLAETKAKPEDKTPIKHCHDALL